MRTVSLLCLFLLSAFPIFSQSGPTDPRAQKTYAEAQQLLKEHKDSWALDRFKKAAKQDGKCIACDEQILSLGLDTGDYKAAMNAGQDIVTLVHTPQDIAGAHHLFGIALMRAGATKHNNDLLTQSEHEFKAALDVNPNMQKAIYADGMALAWLNQDAAAGSRFTEFLKAAKPESADAKRAVRYIERPELVRAQMAPAFNAKTIDGRVVSLDDLAGKVVLIDFWATWCGPCREALAHVREIAHKFAGQPFVVMSISLDTDDQKWRDFVSKNEMTWLQTRNDGFEGSIPKLFGVHAIPATFTIDADGVLQDQHVGDAAIEGKLKKLISRAQALQTQATAQAHPTGGQ